jgi:hypothetical protein
MSSTSDLEVGWRRGKQGGNYSLVGGGGGAAHRKRGQRRGGSPVEHEVGNNIAMVHSLSELEQGKRERRGWDSCDKETCERRTGEKRNERGGVWYLDEGEKPRADKCAGERWAYSAWARRVRRHAAATRARHTWAPPLTASAGHAVTATQQV